MAEKPTRSSDQSTAEADKAPGAAASPSPPAAAPSLELVKREVPMKPLNEMRFTGLEFKQNQWAAFVEKGTTIEHLLTREFWANNAAKLRPFDKIVVMTDDRRLYVELVVFAVGANWAQVRVHGQPIIVTDAIARSGVADDFAVEDLGLQLGWGVIRKSDNRIVKGDGTLKTEDAARAWLREYLASIGRRTAA